MADVEHLEEPFRSDFCPKWHPEHHGWYQAGTRARRRLEVDCAARVLTYCRTRYRGSLGV